MSKECLFCYVTFEQNKPKQKFCSAKCRVYFSRKKEAVLPASLRAPASIQTGAIANHVQHSGDPKEGSGGFFLKYGCMTYEELKELKTKRHD